MIPQLCRVTGAGPPISGILRAVIRVWLGRASLVAATSIAGLVSAQAPHLDRGVELLDEGLFDEALLELDASLESDPLDRDALVRLFVHRALVLSGLGRDADADLRRLGSLGPSDDALRRLPPPLRTVVDGVLEDPGPMTLSVDSEATPGNVRIQVRIRGDVGALVESFRVRARVRGREWVEGTNSVTLAATDEREIEYIAEAIGPRDIVLVRDGDDAAPTALRTAPPVAAEPAIGIAPPPRESRAGLWVGVTLLVVAVAAGATVTAILLTNRDPSDTQVGMPMVEFP